MPSKLSSSIPKYRQIHLWVERRLGTPSICYRCGSEDKDWYDWANISGEYRLDITDWERLCRYCHVADTNDNKCYKGHELTLDNVYTTPSTGGRSCLLCKKALRKKYWEEHTK